jgi:hypothetical protein
MQAVFYDKRFDGKRFHDKITRPYMLRCYKRHPAGAGFMPAQKFAEGFN